MKIYVGNLSYQTTEEQLSYLFSEFGTVKTAQIVTDNYTKRSRGFGFVEMADKRSGEKAIEKLDKSYFQTQTITVNEARPRTNDRTGYNTSKRY